MPMLEARADRVKTIAAWLYGRVVSSDGNTITAEIPADMAGAAASAFGMAGLSAVIVGQHVEQAPRRVTSMTGHTIVCDGDMVTMAFYRYRVDLRPEHAAVENNPPGGAIALTRPTPPFVG
jgi:hypothetical protein